MGKEPRGSILMHDARWSVKKDFVPIGSFIDNGTMGRPKKFNREGVLKKALPVFWRRGFADASLHELEVATGVNKSGLYSEFKDKEDLFMQSLQYYLESLEKEGLLTAEPLGWNNIERFLKTGPCSMEGQKGCFAVSSMREFAILPPEAVGLITRSRSKLKQLLAKNIEVERPKMNANSLAELVLTFFTGLSMEHNLSSSRPSIVRKIDELMNIIRTLWLTTAGAYPAFRRTVVRSGYARVVHKNVQISELGGDGTGFLA
jgi:TetR/AcrR family transcriptional regulator, copper-responsive repressor